MKTLNASVAVGKCTCVVIAVLSPRVSYAGQTYVSVVFRDTGLANSAIEINCQDAITRGLTAPDGACRVNVSSKGNARSRSQISWPSVGHDIFESKPFRL